MMENLSYEALLNLIAWSCGKKYLRIVLILFYKNHSLQSSPICKINQWPFFTTGSAVSVPDMDPLHARQSADGRLKKAHKICPFELGRFLLYSRRGSTRTG